MTSKDGVELFVRLTPRAARDEIGGVEASADGRSHLAVRVRAVPDKGKANAALEKLVAEALRLPSSSVQVRAGAAAEDAPSDGRPGTDRRAASSPGRGAPLGEPSHSR